MLDVVLQVESLKTYQADQFPGEEMLKAYQEDGSKEKVRHGREGRKGGEEGGEARDKKGGRLLLFA